MTVKQFLPRMEKKFPHKGDKASLDRCKKAGAKNPASKAKFAGKKHIFLHGESSPFKSKSFLENITS